MSETVIKVDNVYKEYRLGTIGGGTLQGDIQSWWARVRGKDDPNLKIGEKAYKKNERFSALNGISFEVNKGDTLGIIGGNGAGKSTILKILSRVTAPTDGEVYIKGRISSMLEVGTGFNGELTGRENIYLNGAILGMSKAEVDSKIEDIIEFSECRQFIDTPVKRYSSGMYVKLAFSVAAHLDSEILVMDEVLAVGDMKFQQKCLKKMSEVANKEGRTILYVSHNMNTIRQLCNRCVVLNKGEVVYDGDVEEAIEKYLETHINYSTKVDLAAIKRENKQAAKEFKFTDIEILDRKDMIYTEANAKMCFDLSWESNQDIKNIVLRFEVLTINEVKVGVAFSEFFDVKKSDKKQTKRFEFDISNLAPGRYTILLNASSVDRFNKKIGLDHINFVLSFEKVEPKNETITWNKQYWGNVRLSPLVEVER